MIIEKKKFFVSDITSKAEDNIFTKKYGISILIKTVKAASPHLEDYLKIKNNLKGKWYKNYIQILSSDILISIVISNVLPYCIKKTEINPLKKKVVLVY